MRKVVYTSAEIPHLWAHQKVPEARNRQGNLYFQGDTIYSYGSHFPIARLVKFKGRECVLFTTREYSQMTSQHKYAVRRAVKNMTVFFVPSVSARHSEVKMSYKERCDELLAEARKARMGSGMFYRLNSVTTIIKEANRYAEFFGLKWEFKHPPDWSKLRQRAQMLLKRHDARNAERQRVLEEQRKVQEELTRKKFEEVLPVWESGGCPTNILPRTNTIYLRLTKGGRRIETSWGAQVPLSYAQIIWELVKTCRELSKPMDKVEVTPKAGETERFYQVDRIDADGAVHAGCHHIAWPQIERLAKRLNWLPSNVTERTTAATAA